LSSHKQQIFAELLAEVRRSQNATARFDRAVGDAVGLNLTDIGCLDFLGQQGPVTAGRLAELTGLSSGAMTTALDRLERAGYARRVRDASDRRRVLVETTDKVAELDSFYTEHASLGNQLYDEYTTEQLQLLLGFVKRGRELDERRAAEVERETRAGDARES
jgi:DNA-binding MarR family transcriptional regulator